MVGGWLLDGSCASGTMPAAAASFGFHWYASAGLLVSSHSLPYRVSRKLLSQRVGVPVQVTSRPLVMVSPPLPVPEVLFQPRPCCSSGAASGSGPTLSAGPAPWVLPTV